MEDLEEIYQEKELILLEERSFLRTQTSKSTKFNDNKIQLF